MRHTFPIAPIGSVLVAVALLALLSDAAVTTSAARAARHQSATVLTIDQQTSSKEALKTLASRYGKSDQLLYLYGAREKDDATIILSFPGRLLVAPDQTRLEALLDTTHTGVTITAEAVTVTPLFDHATAPTAKIIDDHGHLVGIIATEAEMEPLRAGAVVRAGYGQAETKTPSGPTKTPPATVEQHAVAAESAPGGHSEPQHAAVGAVAPQTTTEEPPKTQAPAASSHAGSEPAAPPHKRSDAPDAHDDTPHPAAASAPGPAGHDEPQAHDAGHGQPAPPEAPGVAFIDALIKPLQYEFESRFWGWRPNDIIRIGDNVESFQRGVLEMTRRTALVLAESISRTGKTDAFDRDLENAMNWFMIKPERFWFPSAEGQYKDALEGYQRYRGRLLKKQASFFTRADNLVPLLVAYNSLLGGCEENLVKAKEDDGRPVSVFKADDYFYYTQGVVSVLQGMLEAIEAEFHEVIVSRQGQDDLHHAITSCHHALEIDPIIIFDSSPSGLLANHRANLAAPVSHIRFYLGVLVTTLTT